MIKRNWRYSRTLWKKYFQEYRTYTSRTGRKIKLEAAMEKVLEWNKEREHLLEGNVPEKSLGR